MPQSDALILPYDLYRAVEATAGVIHLKVRHNAKNHKDPDFFFLISVAFASINI